MPVLFYIERPFSLKCRIMSIKTVDPCWREIINSESISSKCEFCRCFHIVSYTTDMIPPSSYPREKRGWMDGCKGHFKGFYVHAQGRYLLSACWQVCQSLHDSLHAKIIWVGSNGYNVSLLFFFLFSIVFFLLQHHQRPTASQVSW